MQMKRSTEHQNILSSISFILVLLGVPVGAIAAVQVATAGSNGPTWQMIAIGALSLLITMIGLYAKAIGSQVNDNKKDIRDQNTQLASFKLTIAKDYHDKHMINEWMSKVDRNIQHFHLRLDKAGFPRHDAGDRDE